MAKRSIEETYSEDSNSEFKYDNSEDEFRKKIKLETDLTLDKVQEIEQEIDISEHEVHKFLSIFQTLFQTINSNEPQKETDGLMTDEILQIVNTIIQLLKNNIDSLNIPAVLKGSLKNCKACLFRKQKTLKRIIQVIQNQKMSRTQMRPRRPVRPAGRGEKNNDRIRIRNRRYKIKRYVAQPKNVDVKQNGRVVRRMVVRRQTIYQVLDVGKNIKIFI